MGSLLLFILGVAAPLAVAVAFIWNEDKRRARVRTHVDRLSSEHRGLKMALGGGSTRAAAAPQPAAPVGSDREVAELTQILAQNGILLDWLRLGTREPTEAAARLLGLEGREAGVLQQAIADWGAPGVVAALDRLKDRLASVAEMEMVLADPHAQFDGEAAQMAERVMWVFEPEYVVGEGRLSVDPRIGAIAKPSAGGGLGTHHSKDGDPTLVVELKSARVTVGGDQQLQAWNNVRDLIRSGEVRDRDPVDVFVVGGAVDEFDGNPRVEGRHRNVRITSYDYGQLIARAKRLTFGLYDELKDASPFLRRHREAIAAEQEAAANQAAADAAPADEELADEDHVRSVDDHPVREEDYSDAPRRGEYDENEEDAEPHKRAAE